MLVVRDRLHHDRDGRPGPEDRCEARRCDPPAWPGLIALVVLLGIDPRRFASRLPAFVVAYAGDTLRATAAPRS